MTADSYLIVALAEIYATEDDARAGIAEEQGRDPVLTYRGIWRVPEPYGAVVHLFTDHPDGYLERRGWSRSLVDARRTTICQRVLRRALRLRDRDRQYPGPIACRTAEGP